MNKSRLRNKSVVSSKDEKSEKNDKSDAGSSKKSSGIMKVIIRSDSNIIGHFDNVVVKEKKTKGNGNFIDNCDFYDESESNKKNLKQHDNNPSHSYSFSVNNSSRHNILSSSFMNATEINGSLNSTFSKSMPTTMEFNNGVPVMNPDNIDMIENSFNELKNNINNTNNTSITNNINNINNITINTDINNLYNTDSSSNGNINYNDFLFDDDPSEVNEQSNLKHEKSGSETPTGKEPRKKSKTNNKNVTFNEAENFIPNVYEIHITEESELYCNKCKKKVHIEVKREYSKTFWILFIVLLICGLIFAWIPFLFSRFKFYSFYCKACKKRILKLQQADADD